MLSPTNCYVRSLRTKPFPAELISEYPFCLPVIRNLETIEFHPRVTFFVGENGAGKSTILEALALSLGFGKEGGTTNTQFATADTVSELHEHISLTKGIYRPKDGYFLRAESFYNVASYMDEVGYLGGYGNKSLHARSHGEAFMTLLVDKFKGNGCYLLDEPEAALSPMRQIAALRCIHQLVKADSQFVIATHSPILLAYPDAKLLVFDETGIHEAAFEDTEHFWATRDFLNNYPKRLKQLLDDDE